MRLGSSEDLSQPAALIPAYRTEPKAAQHNMSSQKAHMQSFWERHLSSSQHSPLNNRQQATFEAPSLLAAAARQRSLDSTASDQNESTEVPDHSASPDGGSSENSGQEPSPEGNEAARKPASRKTEQNRRAQQR